MGQKDKKDKKEKDKNAKKEKIKNAKLQLKGRIFMTNVTDVVSLVKPGLSSFLSVLMTSAHIMKALTLFKFGGREIQVLKISLFDSRTKRS